ncbi:hypothetical protein HYH03_000540 [Edaphochlamys debaryana]|uniref:Uncharacterized protein n=1 Tax=Edaphochlamys debaryana TaxID=47281 RepID=A0A836C6A1_9CHLO|nr:hypothetical protein HYH03_000540 [Edaphochlamys debaryana]|eukprot:KAG2502046.1 hypothetical protein HYH03_000540 [Edaphochlamys debaryana]
MGITHTHSVEELAEVVQRYGAHLNPIHTAAAIVKLAKLSGAGSGHGPRRQARWQGHRQTSQRPEPSSLHQQHQGPAFASSQDWIGSGEQRSPDPAAATATPSRGHQHRRGGSDGDHNPSSSPASPSPSASPVLPADALLSDLVASFVAQRTQYPTARQFANVVWALGNMRAQGPALQPTQLLAAAAEQLLAGSATKLVTALPQELSNLALGLAKLGYREVPLWAAIIAAGKARLGSFKPQELYNMAWAVASASQDRSMISAAVQAALPQLDAFSPSGLANLLWACASAQCACEELFDGAAALLLRADAAQLNAQDVANTAWAFAKLQHHHPALMARLGQWVLAQADASPQGRPGLGRAHTQELVNILWAFAALPPPLAAPPSRAAGPQGREAAAGAGAPASASDPDRTAHASTASASGSTAAEGAPLLHSLVAALLPEIARRRDLTPQGAANALLALGRLQPCPVPPEALRALLAAAAALAPRMSDQELCNALWAAGVLRDCGHGVAPAAVAPLMDAATQPARLEALPPVGLAQLVSALVGLRLSSKPAADVVAMRMLKALPALGPQELCVVAQAVAGAVHQASYCNPILLNGLANAAALRVEQLDPQGLSTMLWAFARAKHYHGPLTTSVCRAAAPRLREFTDLELSNLVWALAVLKSQDRQLMVRIAKLLVSRVRARRQRQAAAAAALPASVALGRAPAEQASGAGTGAEAEAMERGQQWDSAGRRRGQRPGSAPAAAAQAEQQQRHAQPQVAARAAEARQAAESGEDGSYQGSRSPHTSADADGNGAPSSSPPEQPRSPANGAPRPASSAPPAASSSAAPDSRPLLRRLPHLDHTDDTAVQLQPRRPLPREARLDAGAAASGRLSRSAADAATAAALAGRRSVTVSATRSSDSDLEEVDGGAGLGPAGGANLTPQGHAKSMVKLLWSFAKANLYNRPLFALLTQELRPLLHLLTPHELTQTLWAVAYHGHACPDLLDAAAPVVLGRLRRLCAWDGSVVAWAYAKLQHRPARELLEALQHHALRVAEYQDPSLLRLGWACSRLGVALCEPLHARLVELRATAARRQTAASSYDGGDGERRPPTDAGRVEPEWW